MTAPNGLTAPSPSEVAAGVRANELKERNFAEYFLIGTLTSTLLALVVGLVVRWLAAGW